MQYLKDVDQKIVPGKESTVTTQCNSPVSRSQNPAILLLICSSYASCLDTKSKVDNLVQILYNIAQKEAGVQKLYQTV